MTAGELYPGVPKCLPYDLSHKLQWWESMGEKNTFSHVEDLLIWGCLANRKLKLLFG
jgi:hypothetical protein